MKISDKIIICDHQHNNSQFEMYRQTPIEVHMNSNLNSQMRIWKSWLSFERLLNFLCVITLRQCTNFNFIKSRWLMKRRRDTHILLTNWEYIIWLKNGIRVCKVSIHVREMLGSWLILWLRFMKYPFFRSWFDI